MEHNGEINLPARPRRNRKSAGVRALVAEHRLLVSDLIMPLFVIEGENRQEEIASMPGIFRRTADLTLAFCRELARCGVRGVAPFPALTDARKDRTGSESWNPDGLFPRLIATLKRELPELTLFTDVALDPYSADGHDGLVDDAGNILNDETLPLLAKMALTQARAGTDFIAPSDMMDGRVGYLRRALDAEGFTGVGILAYTAKYASAFYGPFRDALDSAPRHGDKKTYQMDTANVREALRETRLDIAEGADMVMVKPGLPYLDVVRAVADISEVPVAVYNVSGEYAMLRAAAERGWLDYRGTVLETLLGFKRAGADLILSYHAGEVAAWLAE